MDYSIRRIYPFDKMAQQQWLTLLQNEGIAADQNLEYTVGLYDAEGKLVATGSYYKNTLRCLAVADSHRGEGLLNTVVSHLVNELAEQGVFDLFLYTKPESARFFGDLGFTPLATVDGKVVFMENSRTAFQHYLSGLAAQKQAGQHVGAIVMNANPFTLGHRYLIETAAAACDVLHVFVVREDVSAVPFQVRKRLVMAGTSDLPNLLYHDTGSYMVSHATFPSYFIKDSEEVTKAHARVDAAVFEHIAKALDIRHRYVGDEPFSFATNLYNMVLKERLPLFGVQLHIIQRKEDASSTPISATRVRALMLAGDLEGLRALVPPTTYDYLASQEGQQLMERLRRA